MELYLTEIAAAPSLAEARKLLQTADYHLQSLKAFVSRPDCPIDLAFELCEKYSDLNESVLVAILESESFKKISIEAVMEYAEKFDYRDPIVTRLMDMITAESIVDEGLKEKLLAFAKKTNFEYEIQDMIENPPEGKVDENGMEALKLDSDGFLRPVIE